jgi:hypothetical protein
VRAPQAAISPARESVVLEVGVDEREPIAGILVGQDVHDSPARRVEITANLD